MGWAKQQYKKQYEVWVPWLEDKFLALFGQNKTSYVAKGMFARPYPWALQPAAS